MKLPTSIALSQDVRDALDRLAEAEARSRSWIAERLLREGVAARVPDSVGAAPSPTSQQAAA